MENSSISKSTNPFSPIVSNAARMGLGSTYSRTIFQGDRRGELQPQMAFPSFRIRCLNLVESR